MEGKQVEVYPCGIYHYCPHCGSCMQIEYHANYCPDCGKRILWDDVNEFNDITSKAHDCGYEDTDERCRWYGGWCEGSLRCKICQDDPYLKKYIGQITSQEKERVLQEKGWA